MALKEARHNLIRTARNLARMLKLGKPLQGGTDNMLFKLNNVIQPFAWGSKTMLSQWAGIPNPDNQPQAELWMGVHPSGESRVAQTNERLSEVIARDIPGALGDYTARHFGQLPFYLRCWQ
ncbi:type I phosphomannose isomerase catalytic subunit [Mangrovibacter sp. SLW1]